MPVRTLGLNGLFFRGHKVGLEESHDSGWPHWVIAAFTLALVICAAFQVKIMYLQTKIMADAAKQTDQLIDASQRNAKAAQSFAQSADAISHGMQQAAETLNTQAGLLDKTRLSSEKAFQRTLEETKQNTRLERRAWIAIKHYELLSFEGGHVPEATITFSNSGRTPALNLKAIFLGGTVLKRNASQSQIESLVSKSRNAVPDLPLPVIGPLGEVDMHPRESQPLPQQAYDMVMSQNYDMYFLGRLDYDDVSMRHQWLTICMKVQNIDGKPELRYCSAGNETSYQIE